MKDDILRGARVYAFGDSVVYGHTVPEKSFMRIIADEYGIALTMCAVNGATVMTLDSAEKEAAGEATEGNYILNQVINAPDDAPDIIIFNGGTNDSYSGSDAHPDLLERAGALRGAAASEFDTTTFYGGFESIVYHMRKKWRGVPIVYVTVHKSGGREWTVQCRAREMALEVCAAWGVRVCDIFADSALDTRDAEQMKKYIINGAGSHPNETACGKFYVPAVAQVLRDIMRAGLSDTVDLFIFAGQSNMSGRGDAEEAVSADPRSGREYRPVSNPTALLPIAEPFGRGEDRRGGLDDIGADGVSKRRGSMVSAFADAYYKGCGHSIIAVAASKGGTGTEEWTGGLVDDAVSRLDAARAFLSDAKIKPAGIYVVWSQGESDGDRRLSAGEYTANTEYIFDKFKEHGAEKLFVVRTGHYNHALHPEEYNGLTGAERDECYAVIREAQRGLCAAREDAVLAASFEPYIGQMRDRFHYRQSAYDAVGKAAGETAARYVK